MKVKLLILLVVLLPYITIARIITVPGDYPKIQSAINASQDGDTVVVYPGTYHENIRFLGKKIVVTSRFIEHFDNSFILSTIIDGSTPASPDTGSVVLFINHEDSTSVIQGFTLTGGTGTNWRDEHGAGVYREGGAVLSALSAPTIKNNLMVNNTCVKNSKVSSAGGGAIRSGDGFPRILNNVIIHNKGRYGGAIVLNYTNAIVRNNIIYQNSGGEDYGGGAIWVNRDLSTPKIIENNTIVGNSTVQGGAGYNDNYGSTTILRNNIFWGNTGPLNIQIYIKTGNATVTYCDVQGGFKGNGNINIDPGFSDSLFILMAVSPCIDAGDSSVNLQDQPDPAYSTKAQWPSLGGLRNDIGAYGGQGSSALPFFTILTSITEHILNKIPKDFMLYPNYPNPFNPSTIINYQLSTAGKVKLKIYDVLGKEIKTLADDYEQAGYHHINFDASGLSNGVYFYNLIVNNYSDTKKMTLLK
jgi:hypothetical protein